MALSKETSDYIENKYSEVINKEYARSEKIITECRANLDEVMTEFFKKFHNELINMIKDNPKCDWDLAYKDEIINPSKNPERFLEHFLTKSHLIWLDREDLKSPIYRQFFNHYLTLRDKKMMNISTVKMVANQDKLSKDEIDSYINKM